MAAVFAVFTTVTSVYGRRM